MLSIVVDANLSKPSSKAFKCFAEKHLSLDKYTNHQTEKIVENFQKAPIFAFQTNAQTLAKFFPHSVKKVALRAENQIH